MTETGRPNPDELLRRVQNTEKTGERTRGRFKIFLGYSAGVGKTYQMLEEARLLKTRGVDVAIGLVETHGRSETETLLEGFEIIPRLRKEYQGVTLTEMDVDAVEARRPGVVLVDELAHTNVPGSRNNKRFQDVEDLLAEGIAIYTTLNIQHLESFNDIVHQITGIRVQETVPDRLLETADEIELVDLPPDALLKRFQEGKVYVPAKAKQALLRFFRKGTLLALREISLRVTTQHAGKNLHTFMEAEGIPGPWSAGSRLLVCISPSRMGERLVRTAQRLSADMQAEWFAVHVDLLQAGRMDETTRNQLSRNMRMAEELGGKSVTLTGIGAAEEILRFARNRNVSLIVVGYPEKPRWRELITGSFTANLMRRSGDINVFVVSGRPSAHPGRPLFSLWGDVGRHAWIGGVVSVAVMTLACMALKSCLGLVNITMLMILPVVFSGVFWKWSAGLIASLLAVASLDFFFVPPLFTFAIADWRYLPMFLVFFAVAVITCFLADLIHKQEENAGQRERFVSALYSFSRDLMTARALDDLLQQATRTITEAFQCEVIILLPDETSRLKIMSRSGEKTPFGNNELGVAVWVFQRGQPAGQGTETLSSASWRCLPLKNQHGIFGVLALHARETGRFLSPEERMLLDSFANIVALALERTLPFASKKTS